MTAIERFGGCRHGEADIERKRAKNRIKTVTKALPLLQAEMNYTKNYEENDT
ncbi:MAG: hypothetical protein J6N53_02150 [Lachnospiraceae bacterium]|nr:hypothetical protein [Lachnospiraceae bacterium]